MVFLLLCCTWRGLHPTVTGKRPSRRGTSATHRFVFIVFTHLSRGAGWLLCVCVSASLRGGALRGNSFGREANCYAITFLSFSIITRFALVWRKGAVSQAGAFCRPDTDRVSCFVAQRVRFCVVSPAMPAAGAGVGTGVWCGRPAAVPGPPEELYDLWKEREEGEGASSLGVGYSLLRRHDVALGGERRGF